MRFIVRPLLAAIVATSVTSTAPLLAADTHDHHQHQHHGAPAAHGNNMKAGGATEVPPLRILYPQAGAVVGTQLAIVFETPGDMQRLTMSAAEVGTHLHIETDGISLMPVENQLIRLGSGRYVFVFDLPVKPGQRELRVYWSDGMHKTIDASMQVVKVTVEGD
jgi:hypothetical protein